MIQKFITKPNTDKKISNLEEIFLNRQIGSVLDFGCGDLSLAENLHGRFPKLKITGIDVVDFSRRINGVHFKKYNGSKIPFSKDSFDTVISYHVLHHTPDPSYYFKECARVAKRYIILVEPSPRIPLERPGMMLMDFLFNFMKTRSIEMPFTFLSVNEWQSLFKAQNLAVLEKRDVEILPVFFPTGRSYLYLLEKRAL